MPVNLWLDQCPAMALMPAWASEVTVAVFPVPAPAAGNQAALSSPAASTKARPAEVTRSPIARADAPYATVSRQFPGSATRRRRWPEPPEEGT